MPQLFIDATKISRKSSPKRHDLNSWRFDGIVINCQGLVGFKTRQNLPLLVGKNNKRYGERLCFSDLKESSTKPLGQGASSVVTKCVHVPSGIELASKKICCFKTNEISAEIQSLTSVKTTNVVNMYDAFCHDGHVYLVLEYMDVTLDRIISSLISSGKTISENALSAIAYQLLNGLKDLKDARIVHRDLKPSNILLNKNGKVAISDFGCAAVNKTGYLNVYKGTTRYMSPERLLGTNYSFAADIWSLGMTLSEVVLLSVPFESDCPSQPNDGQIFEYHSKITTQRVSLPNSCSSQLVDFIHKCLHVDPNTRSAPLQLLEHPWIAQHRQDHQQTVKKFIQGQFWSTPKFPSSNST